MANARIRFAPLYLGDQKFAEAHTINYTMTSGDEMQFGAEGYIGHSDGATTTKFSCTAIVPVAGTNVDVVNIIKNKEYVDAAMPLNGRFHRVSVRCVTATYDTDRKTGKLEGKFDFEGGDPNIA